MRTVESDRSLLAVEPEHRVLERFRERSRFRTGGILADKTGSGKTRSVLELVRSTWLESRDETTLVLCSPNIIMQWKHEAARYTPDLPVTLLYGTYLKRSSSMFEKPSGLVLSTPQTFFK